MIARRFSGRLLAAVAFALALAGAGVPALAVDRAIGADVPKPSPSGAPWTDAEISALNANVGITLAGAAVLRGAHVGILAVDARDGRVLFQRNSDELFQPASTLKLLVGSAALDKLGADYRFHTDAVAAGPIAGGTLAGKLIVRAGGDPFLKDADFDALSTAVAAAGIRHIRDGVGFDVSRGEPTGYLPGWTWDDFPYAYAPVVGALAFEENVVHLTVTPGSVAGGPAVVTSSPLSVVHRPIEGCSFGTQPLVVPEVTTGTSDASDSVDLVRTPFGCTRVTGTIPFGAKAESVDAAVAFPTVYAASALRAALQRHGVDAGALQMVAPPDLYLAAAPAGAAVVWSHDSEPLRDAIADCWLPSDNLVAEMLLRELGFAATGTTASTRAGIAWEKTWLKTMGIDDGTVALEDGSGLSTYDRIAPRDLVTVLAHDWNGPARDAVLDALPIAGVRGTLQTSFTGTPAERHVFAKTGSFSHVSALAGYVANTKHGAVIFAFTVDDWIGERAALSDVRARVLARFAQD